MELRFFRTDVGGGGELMRMLTEGLRRSWDVGSGDWVWDSVEVWDSDMLTEDDEEELLSEEGSSASSPSEWNWH